MLELVSAPFMDMMGRLLKRAPGFAAAFLFLLVGLVAARWLRSVLEKALQKAAIDDHTASVGINEVLARLGLGKSPTYVAGFLVYWSVLMVFFVAAANAVSLPAVDDLLERFVAFLPSIAAAILLLFGGMLFARFLSLVVANAAAANNIRGQTFLSKSASAIVIAFACLQALEQLGIRMELVRASALILMGSAGLAFALAFGLGGRDIAAEILRDALNRKKE